MYTGKNILSSIHFLVAVVVVVVEEEDSGEEESMKNGLSSMHLKVRFYPLISIVCGDKVIRC